MKNTISLVAATTLIALGSAQAVTVFTDTFNYTTDGAFIAEGGWTTVINTSTAGGGLGSAAGSGIMFGNPGNGESALEYNHTVTLTAGDVIKMDANLDRVNGYSYGMRIFLWDGVTSGSRVLSAGGTEAASSPALTTVSYTVTAADITAGRDQVIFKYSNDGAWGQTNDVTFDIESAPVPEPSGTAILGLAGVALLLRRRK
ncbi:MAG: PEP-CTERM sorting domain-containing protein [Akkermansiaceae bacterium]